MSGNADSRAAPWSDLGPRIASAVVLVIIGGAALWFGGLWLGGLVVMITGLMMWELARMTREEGPDVSILLGILAASIMALNLLVVSPWPLVLMLLPSLLGVLSPNRDPHVFAGYALVIMLAGLCLVVLRQNLGLTAILAVILAIIASDVAGYFVGRKIGGPKLWPRISPKKTWSGTVAGWVAAGLVGFVLWGLGQGAIELALFLPLLALAGQVGDIVESAIKRRAGIKDASNLIPGHGGLMDRFDAMAFAVIAAVVFQSFWSFLPAGG